MATLSVATAIADSTPPLAPTSVEPLAGGPATGSPAQRISIAGESHAGVPPAPEPKWAPGPDAEKGKLTSFFLIGLVINLILILAAGIWAYREWQRHKQ